MENRRFEPNLNVIFCDFFAILSAHEFFASHLKFLVAPQKFQRIFKNRYQILSNPYVSTSRENRRRIRDPAFATLPNPSADLYRRRCIIFKEGNARVFHDLLCFRNFSKGQH